MSHDTDDVFDGIGDAIFWGPSPSTPIGCLVYLILIAVVVAIAYSCTGEADDACRTVAGENYDRIDGICYRAEPDGTLIPVETP
jgi:hypothetical protein